MFDLTQFVAAHWQWVFILVGGVLLVGAILGWDFAVNPTRWEDRYSFHFISWRFKMAVSGAVLIGAGILLLFAY